MKYIVLVLSATCMLACNWAKQKTKEGIHKTGEIVAKSGSEFADGVATGVEKTFENQVIFSDALQKAGLHAGKIIITSTDSTTDNVLATYLVFDENFDKPITVKAFTANGQEYGRATQQVSGIKGEAKYIDFVFQRRTNIDGKGKITFE